MLQQSAEAHQELGLNGKVLGVDHLATRVLAGEREDSILEFLTMVPYYFWGAYNISRDEFLHQCHPSSHGGG